MPTLMIMAGGTGGHIMPGLAVAEQMQRLGWRVVWMGNPDGMEARLVPAHGYQMAWVRFSALRGKGLLRKLALPFNLLQGLRQAGLQMRRFRPDVVLGMGGFISFPGGMMAALTRRPLVLHEQNSIAGLANKVLASLARRVLTGFPAALGNAQWCGNPVRAEIAALPPPAERFRERGGNLRVLVLGGSLGAQVLNEVAPQALALIPDEQRPEVVHQSGEKHLQALKDAYAKAGVKGHLVPFIEDMAGAYAWADLVVCRSGALTVAELAAAGAASVLVPFPHAVDDHQTMNARFLADAGAAILVPQTELTADKLALLRTMSRDQLLQMAEKARALAKADAAAAVAQACVEVAK